MSRSGPWWRISNGWIEHSVARAVSASNVSHTHASCLSVLFSFTLAQFATFPPLSLLPSSAMSQVSCNSHYSSQSGTTASGSQYGHNSSGNHYCTRGDSTASGGAYHYSNANGSYYYQNSNGSTYYANPNTGQRSEQCQSGAGKRQEIGRQRGAQLHRDAPLPHTTRCVQIVRVCRCGPLHAAAVQPAQRQVIRRPTPADQAVVALWPVAA